MSQRDQRVPAVPSYEHRDSFIARGRGSQTGRRYRRQNINQRKHRPPKKGPLEGTIKEERWVRARLALVAASIEMLSEADAELTVRGQESRSDRWRAGTKPKRGK